MDTETMRMSISLEVTSCDRDVAAIAAASQANYRANAEAGSTIPTFGRFDTADEGASGQRARRVEQALANIDSIIDRAHSAHLARISASASADDVATVQLALGRESVSADELQALYDRHKGNHQLASAIVERANRDHIAIAAEPVPASDVDAAKRAARILTGRYRGDGSVMTNPDFISDDITLKYEHRDVLGRLY